MEFIVHGSWPEESSPGLHSGPVLLHNGDSGKKYRECLFACGEAAFKRHGPAKFESRKLYFTCSSKWFEPGSFFTHFSMNHSMGQILATSAVRLRRSVASGLRGGLDLLCPSRCLACDDLLESDEVPFCEPCRLQMTLPATHSCPRCGGKRGAAAVDSMSHCGHCRETPFAFERAVTLGLYEGELRRLVLHMKTERQGVLAAGMAALLWQERKTALKSLEADCIIPVPMHRARKFWRGVNSPEILAAELGQYLRRPVWRHLVGRPKATKPQFRLTPKQRIANLRDAFAVRQRQFAWFPPFLTPTGICGRRILLVDDILTTGSTLNMLSQILLEAGANSVVAVVMARSVGNAGRNLL